MWSFKRKQLLHSCPEFKILFTGLQIVIGYSQTTWRCRPVMLQLECMCLCVYKGTFKGIYLWACLADLCAWLLPTAGAIHPVSSQGSFGSLWFLKDNDTPGSIWHDCEAKQCQQMTSWMSAHSQRHWGRSQKQELHSCQRMDKCQQKVLYHCVLEMLMDADQSYKLGFGSSISKKQQKWLKANETQVFYYTLRCFMLLEALDICN